jgi:hypothetical protein
MNIRWEVPKGIAMKTRLRRGTNKSFPQTMLNIIKIVMGIPLDRHESSSN